LLLLSPPPPLCVPGSESDGECHGCGGDGTSGCQCGHILPGA
jgi:hypothetical protein